MGIKYKLTKVPTVIPPNKATANGFCNSDPIPGVSSNGIMASVVVMPVIRIGFSLLCPPITIDLSNV